MKTYTYRGTLVSDPAPAGSDLAALLEAPSGMIEIRARRGTPEAAELGRLEEGDRVVAEIAFEDGQARVVALEATYLRGLPG